MENQEKPFEPVAVHILAFAGPHLPEGYVNYVKDRWVKTYRKCNRFMNLVDPGAYYRAYPKYIASILSRPSTTVRLAALADTPDVLLGFSVSEGRILHYVNVPLDYRGQGIARKLVPYEVASFSHITETGLNLWTKKAPEAIFDPFI